ncbi:MAG: orotate phosphoribosyltransferase [Saprospiraceae bacterium]|nr:orotate phosphoribosyltransferase [Saprospiraceae bacterium]MDZ4706719.1 orotate phosphoribosyltransferase [Saprospiraceae bacterium]
MVSSNIATEIAKHLLQIKAIKLSPQKPFTWASGLKSPIYCDNRMVLSHPAIRRFVIDCFAEKAKNFAPFDLVAGVATAGIAHGALLADRLDLPFVYVRAKAKEHGRQNLIEGEVLGHERVLVIEDLISTGGSSLSAIEVLKEAGCTIAGVLAIFTYSFDAATEAFDKAACPLDTLSQYGALIQEAARSGYITGSELELLQSWRADPKGWSAAG